MILWNDVVAIEVEQVIQAETISVNQIVPELDSIWHHEVSDIYVLSVSICCHSQYKLAPMARNCQLIDTNATRMLGIEIKIGKKVKNKFIYTYLKTWTHK